MVGQCLHHFQELPILQFTITLNQYVGDGPDSKQGIYLRLNLKFQAHI